MRIVDDRVTGAEISSTLVLSVQLLIVAGLNVAAMVLVEVVKLVIDINRAFNVVLESGAILVQVYHARQWVAGFFIPLLLHCLAGLLVVILNDDFLDLVRHHVEYDTSGKEDHRKDGKGERR